MIDLDAQIAVMRAINQERQYQERKWGGNSHSVGEWLLILESELQEAKQGYVKGQGSYDALLEVLQVAAVAVACLEEHGVITRPQVLLDRPSLGCIKETP